MVIQLNDTNFDPIVHAHKTVVVEFGGEFCAPCKVVKKQIEKLAGIHKDVVFGIFDVEGGNMQNKFGVNAVPAVLIFKDGSVAKCIKGKFDRLEEQIVAAS